MTAKNDTGSDLEEDGEAVKSWPDDVEPITWDSIERIGVHRRTNALFWDGKEIVTKNMIRLGTREAWFAGLGVFTGFVGVAHEIGKTAGFW